MRLAALALHAHAATSRFTTAPTARFSVVVARAMSELVGGGDEPTTTAEERAEAATLRTTEGAAEVAPTVAMLKQPQVANVLGAVMQRMSGKKKRKAPPSKL